MSHTLAVRMISGPFRKSSYISSMGLTTLVIGPSIILLTSSGTRLTPEMLVLKIIVHLMIIIHYHSRHRALKFLWLRITVTINYNNERSTIAAIIHSQKHTTHIYSPCSAIMFYAI